MGKSKNQRIRSSHQSKVTKLFVSKRIFIRIISTLLLLGLLAGLWCWQSFVLAKGSLGGRNFAQYVNGNSAYIAKSPPFPSPKLHPLPPSLAKWQDEGNAGDYFQQVQGTNVGYLVWSKFPVRVYIQTPPRLSPEKDRKWVKEISQTVDEWQQYLPLEITSISEQADIKILRKVPPLQINPLRARSALASYSLYVEDDILRHKFTILLSPSLSGKSLQASSRHELGHALGIWGHSPRPTDALYFSQVANPPYISSRDVNTLKKVYQQPTSLGWMLGKSQIKKGENIR